MPGPLDNLEEAIRKLQDLYDDPDIVIPASQLPEKENPYKDFEDRNPMAGGGMLVQPSADGSRPGYAGNKGYVKPLSPELQKLFNKTNPGEEWGKGKFADEKARGNWKNDAPRKQKILNVTSNLITQEELSKILTEELGEEISGLKIMGKYGVGQRTKFSETIDNLLFKGTYGSIKGGKNVGGSLRYFKKPSKNDIKKILKSGTLGDVRINTLKTNTVKNVLKLNKKYSDIYKAGEIPDIELVMKATGMTEQSAGTATARLAQIYNGHKFNNKDLKGIRVNKKTASKMFEIMDKSPFGNPYRNSLYKVSLTTIDQKLGNETGTFESLKKKATKILKDNKIPIYDFKKGDKAFGFNINEIAGVTGSAKSKAAEFSQFIDIMEGNLNQKTLANFQGQLSIARQNIENNPDMLSSESKRINKLARSLEGQYDVELPRLKDPDATKFFSPSRIRELNAQGIDVVKAAERAGYTIQMPKKAITIQEFVDQSTPQAKKIIQNIQSYSKLSQCKVEAADGGRIGFKFSDECIRDGLKEQKIEAQKGNKKAAKELVQVGKIATRAGLLKNILGPGAILGEAVFEGVLIGNRLLEGKPLKQAWAQSYLSYLDPRKYSGELDPTLLQREQMLESTADKDILRSGFAAQDQLSAFNKALLDRDLAKARGRTDQYLPAAADAREQGRFADQSADIISSEAFKDASNIAQEYIQGQEGQRMLPFNQFKQSIGRFESGEDRDYRRRKEQEMKNLYTQYSDDEVKSFLKESFGTDDDELINKYLELTGVTKRITPAVTTTLSGLDLLRTGDQIQQAIQRVADAGGVANLAGGGIAKSAGINDGPPPARGPNPQGLSYLMKRGMKI
jgi:hypothetical protein|tara:strand:+ start:24 stop:2573 length:2550 start_codon:yes stop_codon:yes gene_type:complete